MITYIGSNEKVAVLLGEGKMERNFSFRKVTQEH